jgi:hypothetical protein
LLDHTDGLDDPNIDTHPFTRMEPQEDDEAQYITLLQAQESDRGPETNAKINQCLSPFEHVVVEETSDSLPKERALKHRIDLVPEVAGDYMS